MQKWRKRKKGFNEEKAKCMGNANELRVGGLYSETEKRPVKADARVLLQWPGKSFSCSSK